MRSPIPLILLTACGAQGPGTSAETGSPPGASAGSPTAGTGSPTSTGSTPTSGLDLRQRGPWVTTATDEQVAAATCTMDATRYASDAPDPGVIAVLSHGFQRNRSHMAALADHWASWGLVVITPDLCHATAFDSDHEANALDLEALAGAVAPGVPVLYAGHSAGGLASWLAAASDPDAIAHLGLDPVDSAQLGAAADGSHPVPTYGLLAEPGICNSQSNAASWYGDGADDRAIRITGADHCDFESPTDALCTAFCAGGAANDATVAQIVVGMGTAFALWQTGLAPAAEAWWTPGDPWNDLVLGGAEEL